MSSELAIELALVAHELTGAERDTLVGILRAFADGLVSADSLESGALDIGAPAILSTLERVTLRSV